MSVNEPLVGIGMPVYNEERYLSRALESLLKQDYENIELTICDNGSQDAIQDIALEYAARNSRIHYHRNDVNSGAVSNFNQAFRLSPGEYFMWAAADDLWAPTYISRCLGVLRSDPNIVLAYPLAILTDDEGREHGTMAGRVDTRDFNSKPQRFLLMLLGCAIGNMVYGLMRSDLLRRTKLMRQTSSGDLVLLAELATWGTFAHIPEPLFYRRRIRKGEDFSGRQRRWNEQLNPQAGGIRGLFPYRRLIPEYIDIALHVPVRLRHKLAMLIGICLFVPWLYRHVLLRARF